MAVPHATRLRADDLWETPDDGNRYEIIDGVLVMSPPPRWGHQRGISKLHLAVGNHVYANDLGEIVESPVGVILGPTTAVQPDMVFVSESRRHIISERGVEGAPDLVVEVFSQRTRSRDLGIKLRLYEQAGVPYYWTGDPVARRIQERELGPDGYVVVADVGPGEVFRPRLFPGLEIPVDSVWTPLG